MKKLILFFLPLFTVVSNAEELKFVTVLSSPVGSFNKLETVDPATPAKSPTINFCTSIGLGGTVALKGASKPDVETMNLSQNTVLGRAGEGSYVLNQITMKNGGSLKGSRLLANTVQVNQATAGKSDKLYTDTLTVAGAKAEKLNVNNGSSQITEQHSDPGMMWSNQYKTDKACGDDCKNQYLLKEKRQSSACDQRLANACQNDDAVDGVSGEWFEEYCSCACPKGFVVNAQGNCACPDGLPFIYTVNGEAYYRCGVCNRTTDDQDLYFQIYTCEDTSLGGGQTDQEGYGDVWYQESGTWNEETCSCDCPKYTSRGKYHGAVYCYMREGSQDPCGSGNYC